MTRVRVMSGGCGKCEKWAGMGTGKREGVKCKVCCFEMSEKSESLAL